MIKFNIEVPFFPGFYDSIYEDSDHDFYFIREEIDYVNENYGLDLKRDDADDYLEIDYTKRRRAFAKEHCYAFKDNAPSFITSVELTEINSPKYYNFRTDMLYADVEFSDEWAVEVRKFIDDNYETLRKDIKKDWSSYDGFMSFMENDIDKWYEKIFVDNDERYISCIITYMMEYDNPRVREDIEEEVYEEISDYDYLNYTDKLKEIIQEQEGDNPPSNPS